jgi:hypothetical protein
MICPECERYYPIGWGVCQCGFKFYEVVEDD